MRVVWTEAALRDLAHLRTYIERENPSAAERQAVLILDAVERLTQFPEAGRTGRRMGTRELVVSRTPFLVAYRVWGERIDILRVLHGRQRWPGTL